MPKLKSLDLQGTGVELIGGKVAVTLASERLLCLENLGVRSFSLDSEGLGDLVSVVRRGAFPSHLCGITFELSQIGQVGKQALLGVVVKSEGGMSWFKWSDKLDLFRTEALPGAGAAALEKALRLPPSGLFNINLSEARLTDKVLGRLGDAVRAGAFAGVSSLDLSGNWNVGREVWGGFMKVVGESEMGMPKLKFLNLAATEARFVGGPVAVALSSGRLPSLECVGVHTLFFDEAGVEDLGEAVRRRGWPPHLRGLRFRISQVGQVGMETLMGAVCESEEGMPWVGKLDLSETSAGEGADSLGTALMLGKLCGLSDIDLSNSQLTDEGLGRLGDAVRGGGFAGVSSLDLSGNWNVGREAWGGFMRAVGESEMGMPKMKFLNLRDTLVNLMGGPVSFALASGKVLSLEDIGTLEKFYFYFDEKGVGELGNAVRKGGFPARFSTRMKFQLNNSFINLDGLISAIRENEGGLPSFVVELNLLGGRFGKEALASLAASGGGTSGGKLAHLKVLNMSSCAIDADQLGSLGEIFFAHDCRELESLNLKENWINTQGVRSLFDLLTPQSLPKLSSLLLDEQKGADGRGLRAEEQIRFKETVASLRSKAHRVGKLRLWMG
uniref:Uncharacterized protein n=1 Tax=Chromera velia CCMP2878 TaxID=1169474 RepID=A0A0G4GEJ7_9ALVE|eukprot:Cvel_21440.t1-p1 / transcript=Cvel_21440.t1 / gene=Cvel_21440 / organism=Chromera_velia_CCMP2878 / gene_product=hypothetical protein / transcript_product=hypothetical protein / location=Cvel_scaffold2010:16973-18805(+) / protein_length=611 / sequence_SO=supercontig / SO=protein_coding / is_pseudo=false